MEAAEAARKATRAAQRCSQRAARTAEQRAAERAANTAARSASRAAAADEHAAADQPLGDLTNRQVAGSPSKVNAQNKQLELHKSSSIRRSSDRRASCSWLFWDCCTLTQYHVWMHRAHCAALSMIIVHHWGLDGEHQTSLVTFRVQASGLHAHA